MAGLIAVGSEHLFFEFDFEKILANLESYDPKGVLAFFGDSPPSATTLTLIRYGIFTSSAFLIIGLFTRINLIINMILTLLLFSFYESVNRYGYWCHSLNLINLAQIAFVFAPPGKLSLIHI